MDPRIREHARTIVDHSVAIERGDQVIVNAPPAATDLVVALFGEIGERGAVPIYWNADSRASRAYLRAVDEDALALPETQLAAVEAADVVISILGQDNEREKSDVDPAIVAAQQSVTKPIQEAATDRRWVGTQHPTPAAAQSAEMSTEAYAEFVYAAVNRDWEAQREHQAPLVDRLTEGEAVHIRSGEETDLTLSIEGMVGVGDHAENNLPGGEVFTAPVPDSVEGTVRFDKPFVTQGRVVEDVFFRFEGGTVVEAEASANEDLLRSILDTDEGARRLGELGIGTNRAIDRFTYNMLFDEKMGDTVHLALGRAIDETVGDGREANDSAVHLDMIVDMAEDSVIEVDGEVIQRNGSFWFEDGGSG